MRTGSCLRSAVAAIAMLGGLADAAPAADVIMVEDASEPFSRGDGTGYANDIVRAAYRAVGVVVSLDVVPYARCKISLLAGRTPACFSMARSEVLGETVKFSALPIYRVQVAVFQRRDAPVRFAALYDIPAGARVGVVNDYEYPEQVDHLDRAGVVLDAAGDEIVNLKRLARGRLDAVIVMTSRFERPDQRAVDADVADLVVKTLTAGMQGSYLGFSARHPDGDRLRAQFDEGYRSIVASGLKSEIEARWLANVHR